MEVEENILQEIITLMYHELVKCEAQFRRLDFNSSAMSVLECIKKVDELAKQGLED